MNMMNVFANVFAVEIQTSTITAEGQEINKVKLGNVLSISCICLKCGNSVPTNSLLESHTESHSNTVDGVSDRHDTVTCRISTSGDIEFTEPKYENSADIHGIHDVSGCGDVAEKVNYQDMVEVKSLNDEGDVKGFFKAEDGDEETRRSRTADSENDSSRFIHGLAEVNDIPVCIDGFEDHGIKKETDNSSIYDHATNISHGESPKKHDEHDNVHDDIPSSVSNADDTSTFELINFSSRHMRKKVDKQMGEKADGEEKSFLCKICGRSYARACELGAHMKRHRREKGQEADGEEKSFLCKICGRSFVRGCELASHMKLHRREEAICPTCGKLFSRPSSLRQHILTHTGVKEYSCSVCGKCFCLKSQLTSHMVTHSVAKTFTCTVCGVSFSRNSTMQMHRRTVHQASSVMCSICGKTFKQNGGLNRHVASVHEGKHYVCELCGKVLRAGSSYREHRRRHNDERPYMCSLCGKCYFRRTDYNTHTRTHTGDKPYSCSECGKKLNQKYYYEEHMRIHTGEKPFACTSCGMKFRVRAALRKHLKSEHSDKSPRKKLENCSVTRLEKTSVSLDLTDNLHDF